MEDKRLQAVIETPDYLAAAKDAGMSEAEMKAATDMLAKNPLAGELMVGTGGCRKARLAGRGHGKSGGYRTIHFFGGREVPVFLLTVFSKGERANLTKKERNQLEKLTKTLVASLTEE